MSMLEMPIQIRSTSTAPNQAGRPKCPRGRHCCGEFAARRTKVRNVRATLRRGRGGECLLWADPVVSQFLQVQNAAVAVPVSMGSVLSFAACCIKVCRADVPDLHNSQSNYRFWPNAVICFAKNASTRPVKPAIRIYCSIFVARTTAARI